ncbi:MAG: hypothetical protein U5L05_05575 [Rubrivivax sp.]|nr:hypothetical protein [Rubrivivax sp.]
MRPLFKVIGLLGQAAQAFFRHDLAWRRGEDGVHIVLAERTSAGNPKRTPSRAELALKKDTAELALMLEQLRALLAELPGARQTLRHLVFVEQALARKGLRALHKLPLEVLQRALEQLEGLVTNWSPTGLASLRSKMAVAIIDREHVDPDAEADAYRTVAVLDAEPLEEPLPEMESCTDDDALAAAYAALGSLAPAAAGVEMHGELGSPSARAVLPKLARGGDGAAEIRLRELQD